MVWERFTNKRNSLFVILPWLKWTLISTNFQPYTSFLTKDADLHLLSQKSNLESLGVIFCMQIYSTLQQGCLQGDRKEK